MASDYIKNLRIDKQNNKIIADVADGNVKPLYFIKSEIYSQYDNFEEKYSSFIRDIVLGTIQFQNKSNKYSNLEFSAELKNYCTDYRILGAIGVYNKYKSKIEQILSEGYTYRSLEIIPSEIELHYKLTSILKDDFEKTSIFFKTLEHIMEYKKLPIDERKKHFSNYLKTELNESDYLKPIFVLYNKEEKNIIVSLYSILKKYSNKDDVYFGYYINVKNLETNFEKNYSNDMMISYVLENEESTKDILQCYEQDFKQEELLEKKKELIMNEQTEEMGE